MAMVSNLAGNIAFYLAALLVVIWVVMFVHELGHFLVARWCGITVETFSIGVGPEIFGFTDRNGTRWRLAAGLLLAYVKFKGDQNGASVPDRDAIEKMSPEDEKGLFHAKPVWQRAAVVAAGPIANFLLAILIFAGMAMVYGVRTTEPRIGHVLPDHPAAQAGFQAGDLVLAIDGNAIEGFNDLQRYVGLSGAREMSFLIDRGGQKLQLKVVPAMKEHNDEIAGKMSRPLIGVRPHENAAMRHRTFTPVQALGQGVTETRDIIVATWSMLRDVVIRRQNTEQLGGIARIADVAGQAAKRGPEVVIGLIGLISVSVGFMNLLPIPLLDGGHLLFYGIEAARRRPLSEQAQNLGYQLGFAVIISLMIFANFYNDFAVWKKWFS